ncbi:MAG: OsmC family protein [Phycisphaerales bacterium JB043]
MHTYTAQITWQRDGQTFSDNKYSRGHEWSFDGGITVAASSSPLVVRVPYSVADAVDPEEALVASASSCHMLTFLHFAAQGGFIVDSYNDDAVGVMEKQEDGKIAFSRITLRPRIVFTPDNEPTASELESLHHKSHEACFIANSIKCPIVVEEPAVSA